MLELARTVRFCLEPGADPAALGARPRHNTYAGWPSLESVGAHHELTVRCRGPIDPRSGFVMDITCVDRAVREHALPIFAAALRDGEREPGRPLVDLLAPLQHALGNAVASMTWWLTPYHGVTLERTSMNRVRISQRFEFAAAHRLHNPELSDEENRRLYGKCNNPAGHGHNYRVEVAVSRPLTEPGAAPELPLPELERIVDERVISRFDHKHLNHDTSEFADLNPTVEHIARVCFDLLDEPFAAAGGTLESVTVWETEKTSATMCRAM